MFILEVNYLNTVVTSKEAILEVSRQIVIEKGLSDINMRLVANECGIALGSIYNYFPSKADLLTATIESIWKDIFYMNGEIFNSQNFINCISELFKMIKTGSNKYPEFFTLHSMVFAMEDKVKGRQIMEKSLKHLKNKLLEVLNNDNYIRTNAFNEILTPIIFIDYVFTLFISILLQKQDNCNSLLEVIKHCIY